MKYISILLFFLANIPFAFAKKVEFIVTNQQGHPVENMVVYLTPVESSTTLAVNNKPVIISQQNKKFSPYIAVIQKGQQLSFNNLDDITHHIYSVSGENRFSFKLKSGTTKHSPTLNHVEEIAMGCNIHDWMSGYVLVVDTPYYSTTNNEGSAFLSPTHEGDYIASFWHPQLEVKDYKIEKKIYLDDENSQTIWQIQLPKNLSAIPEQENQDDFDFLQEY